MPRCHRTGAAYEYQLLFVNRGKRIYGLFRHGITPFDRLRANGHSNPLILSLPSVPANSVHPELVEGSR